MRTLLLSLSVLLALGAHAQIYKWVDEKGVTHYGESPPPDRKASKVQVPNDPPEVRPPPAQDWSKKELDFRKRQLDRDTQEKADAQQKAYRERECIKARQDVGFLSQPGRHWQMNEKGEKVYQTDEQQAAHVDAARKRVDEFCR